MRKIAVLLLAMSLSFSVNAQTISAATYPFATSSGASLEDLSSGATVLVGANVDDGAGVGLVNIGFEFWLNGVRHTQFAASANGYIRLTTAVTTGLNDYTNSLASTNQVPSIAPYWDDLYTGTNGQVRYKVTGAAPNRKLVVEWQNMQVPRVGSGNTGAGNFQLWLYETTGVIEFVYGSGMAVNSANSGASIGFGTSAAIYASVTLNATSTSSTCAYGAVNDNNTIAITAGTKFTFTPVTVANPTGPLSFSAITSTGLTVNWAAASPVTGVVKYAVYYSSDGGATYVFANTTNVGTHTLAIGSLIPGTSYTWKVISVSEGYSSTGITGVQATNPAGNITSVGAGGNWSNPATWSGGAVPTAGDNVTIVDGSTVTIDVAAFAYSLTVGQGTSGVLQYDATARSLTVSTNVTIAANGTFRSAAAGSTSAVTTHSLVVGGGLTNNGTLNFSATAGAGGTTVNASGATITFTGAADATFDCSNATLTNLRSISGVTVNKGSSNASTLNFLPAFTYQSAAGATSSGTTITVGSTANLAAGMYVSVTAGTGAFAAGTTITSITNATQFVVSAAPSTALSGGASVVTASRFAVLSASLLTGATAGFLTITNGTFKVGGSNTSLHPYFNATAYSIPANGGFWLNNATATVTGQNGSPTMSGLLRITAGTYNVGTASGNAMGGASTSVFTIEGGTLNLTGRLNVSSSGASFNMSGGTINVTTIGNGTSSAPGFGFTSSGSLFTMSGGIINLVQASTAATPLDWQVSSSAPNITGGTLNVGTAATATNFTFRLNGALPNVVIDNTTNNKTATLNASVVAYGNTTINTGATLNLNATSYQQRGATFTNNGTLTGTSTSSRLFFFSPTNTAQTFAGSGTVTLPLDGMSVQNTGGLTITHTNTIPTLRMNLFAGTITNSNKITLGSGAASAVTVQIGAAGSTTAGGNFDAAPVFNLGTGTYTVLYLYETAARTTGFEIPATRSISAATISNPNNVTVAGGPLNIGTLTLQAGKLVSSAANLVTITGTTTSSTVRSTYTSAAGATSSGSTITVTSTTNLAVGMNVTVTAGLGAFAPGTTVASIVNSTSFTVSAAPVTPLSGGASVVSGIGGWVSGPLQLTLPASLTGTTTYSFPIGKSIYSGLDLVNVSTGAAGPVIMAEAFDANSGGTPGLNMGTLNTDRYWAASVTSGNFTSSFIRLADPSAALSSAIAASNSLAGAYDIVGNSSPVIVTGTSVTSAGTASTGIPGYYALGTKAVAMSYVSSTTTQAVTSFIVKPATNQQVIGLQIVTIGNASPLTLNKINFSTNGSTDPSTDIATARVWYTGNSATFAQTTQYGSDESAPNGNFSVVGTQTLAEGTNYFWLVYDVPSGATANNVVDAECIDFDLGTAQVPTVTAPAGSRIIKAPLSGTYLVGASQVLPNYTLLKDALSDLNNYGASGPVTFLLQSDYSSAGESFPLTVNAYAGNSSTNTLTIKPDAGVTAAVSGSSATAIFVINGADYVTIDGSNGNTPNTVCPVSAASRDLTITNTNAGITSAVVWLQTAGTDGATNNRIVNCNIVGNSNTTTLFGLGSGGSSIGTSSTGTGNNNNRFENNAVSKTQYGIYTMGASAANKNQNNVISQNLINAASPNNVQYGGIMAGFENNLAIVANTVSGMSFTGSTDEFGINAGFAANGISATSIGGNECTNVTITKNVIGAITNTGTYSAAGIILGAAASGTSLIANNMISGIASNGTGGDYSAGIILGGGVGSTTQVYYNTVVMQGAITGGTGASQTAACLSVTATAAPVIELRNNIFVNKQVGNTGATVKFVCVALNYASTTGNYAGLTSDHNNFYCAGAGPGTYQVGITGGTVSGTVRTTLANWTAETGRDGAGSAPNATQTTLQVNPVFVSATDLHLVSTDAANVPLNDAAIAVSVTDDIDCNTRSTDIGADEFSPPTCAGAVGGTAAVTGSSSFCGSGTPVITASGYSSGIGSGYQWISSTNSGDYPLGGSPVSGQTNPASLSTGVVSTTTYYWLRVTCTSGTATDHSNMITITINPSAAVITGPAVKCASDPAVTLTESGGTGTSWLWSPGGATTQSISVNPAVSTVYTVQVTSPGGCVKTSSPFTLTVNPNPTGVTAAPSAANVCAGQPVGLTASVVGGAPTILTQDFESGIGSWVIAASASGGTTPALANFTIRNHGWAGGSGSATTFNSPGGSSFILGDPDAAGSGVTFATTLTSPSFSTVGYTAASLNFRHYYRHVTTNQNIEISTNGGGTWAPLQTYSATAGAANSFQSAAISLNAYLGLPDVRIRFNYAGGWLYYWAIDDIAVTGTPVPYTYAWTSTPAGFTSALQNPTGVTPAVNTNYTVTVTGIGGCTSSASTGVVALTNPPNAGTNGALQICATGTVSAAQLFAALGGSPDAGGSWSPAPAGLGSYTYTVNATAPCTGSASATVNVTALPDYAITATAGANGAISPAGITQVCSGNGLVYTIIPNTGYNVLDVTVDGSSVGAVTSYTFTNVTAPHTIHATFTPIIYTITATAGTGGTIFPPGVTNVAYGGSQAYYVTASPGYMISDLKVDNVSQGPVGTYTFNSVAANHTIDVIFKQIVYADPALIYADMTDLSNTVVNANQVPNGAVQRIQLPVLNFSQTPSEVIPAGTTRLQIDLGSKLILDPAFNLATAPLNTYFSWTQTVIGGNVVIIGDQVADIPGDFYGNTYFDVKAIAGGTSQVIANFIVSNHNNPAYYLLDQITGNNSVLLHYTVLDALQVVKDGQTNVSCFGGTNGSITVHGTGGLAPYQYSIDAGTTWLPAVPTNGAYTFAGLPAGVYTILVRDALSQQATLVPNVTITQPAAFSVTANGTNVSCNGGSNGTASALITGGTAPFTYAWTASGGGSVPPAQVNNQSLSGLVAGTYTVTVNDAGGCGPQTSSYTVTQPAPITALSGPTLTPTNISCGGATGAVALAFTAQGGTGTLNYGYAWTASGGGLVPPAQVNSQNLTGLVAGTYSVTITVTDANNCTASFSGSVTLTQGPALVAAVTGQTNVTCGGGSTGSATIAGSGGTPFGGGQYEYSITGIGGPWFTGVTHTFGGLAAGPYTVTVRDAAGCTTTVNFTITQPGATDVTIGSDFSSNFFATNGAVNSIVYTMTEVGGAAASPARIRVFKPSGYNLVFNGALTTITLGITTYTLENSNWTLTTSNALYNEYTRSAPIPCGGQVRISIDLQRNTTNVSTFNLTASFRPATGELITTNNNNSLLMVGQ